MVEQRAPRLDLHNDHNVYILGAGFTADAGLPVMANFVHRMRDYYFRLEADRTRKAAPQEAVAIRRVLEFQRGEGRQAAGTVTFQAENIEDLFSLAAMMRDDELVAQMALAIAATLQRGEEEYEEAAGARVMRFALPHSERELLPKDATWIERAQKVSNSDNATLKPYEFAVGVLSGLFAKAAPGMRNTIITFNYDTIIENALVGLGLPWGYGVQTNGPGTPGPRALQPINPDAGLGITLLKLHGSINWSAGSSYDAQMPVVFDSLRHMQHAETYRPLIVPPSWRKTYDEAIGLVWAAAVKALSEATRVVVIGYSLPPTDTHFKYLLAAGLSKSASFREIHFVDPSSTVRPRVEQTLRLADLERGNQVHFHQMKALNFLKAEAATIGRPRRGDWWHVAVER